MLIKEDFTICSMSRALHDVRNLSDIKERRDAYLTAGIADENLGWDRVAVEWERLRRKLFPFQSYEIERDDGKALVFCFQTFEEARKIKEKLEAQSGPTHEFTVRFTHGKTRHSLGGGRPLHRRRVERAVDPFRDVTLCKEI